MTEEEITRFALQLREAERVRAQIEKDEVAARADGGELPLLATLLVVEQPSESAVVAAA